MNKAISEISLYITKSSLSDGLMKWSAVNSDTEADLYGERMSLELYQKMLGYIKQQVSPPEHFSSLVTSDYWNGGMPYLSIAHYPDLNGKAVPGKPTELFIDGNQLKAKGILFDTPLGRAVWKSLKKDEINTKSSTDNDKIRISIAFLDMKHKHGEDGKVFIRDSISSVCPDCRKKVGNKIYLDGYLVHLALTRVPVNPRTIMKSEDIMAKKSKIETRKEDALSIVEDSELVEEIDKTNALEAKSDVLVEMSDTEEVAEPVVETPVVEDAKRTWKESTKEYSKESTEDDGDAEEMPMDKRKKTMKSLTEEDVQAIATEVHKLLSTTAETPVLTEKVDTVSAEVQEKSALDKATDGLYNSVNSAISMQGVTLEQRLESINPSLQELGNTISALVRESMGQVAPTPQSNETGLVLEAVASLSETVKALATEVATMKAQTPSVNTVQNRVPVPRSIQPQLVAKAQTEAPVNPNSIANIVRRSVSSQLPLK